MNQLTVEHSGFFVLLRSVSARLPSFTHTNSFFMNQMQKKPLLNRSHKKQ